MKFRYFFIILLILPMIVWAQKNQKKTNKPESVTEEERKLSSDYADGLIELYKDNPTQAEKIFRSILEKAPKNDAVYFILGKIYSEKREYTQAAEYFKTAAELKPENDYYQVALAMIYGIMDKDDTAAQIWKKLVKKYPDNESYRYYYNSALLNQGKLTEVLKFYDDFEKKYGIDEESVEIRKNIYLHSNQIDKAVSEIEKLIKKYPYNWDYYMDAGDVYLDNIQPQKAAKYYEKILAADSLNFQANLRILQCLKATAPDKDVYPYLYRAMLSPDLDIEKMYAFVSGYLIKVFETKNSADSLMRHRAETLMDIMIRQYPNHIESWVTKATYFAIQNNYPEAIAAYAKALEIDHTPFSVWEPYLNVLMNAGQYDTIISKIDELTELFPINVRITCYIAEACYFSNQYNKAIQYYEKAAKETYDNALLSYIFSMTAESYYKLENKAKAFEYYEKALKKNSKNVIVLNNYAYFLSLEKEQLEKAKTMAMRLTDLESGNPIYQDTYAWVLYQLGDFENAKIWIEKAIKSGGGEDGDIKQHYEEIMKSLNK